ncbi:MAG: YARHG domain-containing protein [Hyphomicrobiaceae bacterium]
MPMLQNTVVTALLAAAALTAGTGSALAGDPVADAHVAYLGKTHFKHASCDDLWFYRNQIFAEAGYCFKTSRAISTFGNDGCVSGSYSILNIYERANVNMLRSVEQAKGCSL